MINSTHTVQQATLLGLTFILGCFGGFLFDIYRRIRSIKAPGPWVTALGDMVYWGVFTIITFNLLLRISFGQVRGFIFVSLGLGLFLYMVFISPGVVRGLVLVEVAFLKVLLKLKKAICWLGSRKIFQVPGRIWQDARRIYNKLANSTWRR